MRIIYGDDIGIIEGITGKKHQFHFSEKLEKEENLRRPDSYVRISTLDESVKVEERFTRH